jgi:hypothetical protein
MKQETLEEAARDYIKGDDLSTFSQRSFFIAGAKWQSERMYSDEEITKIAYDYVLYNDIKRQWVIEGMKLYREQFKKK